MIALLQRVSEGRVLIDGESVGAIDGGLVVLLGVERDDGRDRADRLLKRILAYRIFGDADGRMNLSLKAVGGGLLLVPQFTLAADTRKGLRPSFSSAADPEQGRALFDYIVSRASATHEPVAAGRFGAAMQVALVNDGPVTFWLKT